MTSLKQGARGPEVAELQRQLNQHLPASQRIPVDGDFGPRTATAVREFQRAQGLDPDGVVGPKTRAALGQAPGASSGGSGSGGGSGGGAQAPVPSGGKGGVAPKLVTLDQLCQVMTVVKRARAETMLDPLNRAMGEFDVNSRLRISAFLAQIAHESGEFRWMEEIASGQAYDITVNRKKALELGNVNPGDGKRYKGRGPIQLTGRYNYRAAGKDLGLDLEGNPTIASQPSVGFRIAGWYWKKRKLNPLADAQNFWDLTYRINSARLHYEDRKKYYNRALKVLA
ncbi:peptidoglycan-binding protein [Chondromyces crocatus]|uniref:Peptidoglycan-binding protein n=1 Tax=Chondromyces crocatus TaxID=52 RepID=A0A0K1E680_CHOCO|nr:peptidoglycan-binding protein [Chondromyces crocatus]AKT36385.1 uncharacterized protein CMC5_004980 [Chondromyces crocatus]